MNDLIKLIVSIKHYVDISKTFCFNSGMKNITEQIIDIYGGVKAVQARFNYTEPMAVYNWRSRGIPKSLIAEIHLDTGIPMQHLLLSTKPRPRITQSALSEAVA